MAGTSTVTQMISVRVPNDLADALKNEAVRTGAPLSGVVLDLLLSAMALPAPRYCEDWP